ncbi:MAG TPA: hypothetical protein VG826_25855 [Pirellulales bacterium]|nr:hypothetical protein [Pirellulales bacterium]
MREQQGTHRWGAAAAALLLLIVLLLYPLSVGPTILMYHTLGEPHWMGFLEVVYAPLFNLPEPFDSMVERYADLWVP